MMTATIRALTKHSPSYTSGFSGQGCLWMWRIGSRTVVDVFGSNPTRPCPYCRCYHYGASWKPLELVYRDFLKVDTAGEGAQYILVITDHLPDIPRPFQPGTCQPAQLLRPCCLFARALVSLNGYIRIKAPTSLAK